MNANISREQNLDSWLGAVFKTSTFTRMPLAGDASFRRYYRVKLNNAQYVAMDAPPPESPALFVKISATLEKQGLQVPKIIASEIEQGFLLLSDLGDRLYLNELTDATVDKLYQDAFQAMLKFQSCSMELLNFDREFMGRQFGIFEEWYLKKHLQISLTSAKQEILVSIYHLLMQNIEVQPQVFVHRDYHSRNLMISDENNPGILDFQDAMRGPMTYDLVSLLQDCYIAWPRERIEAWVFEYYLKVKKEGLLSEKISQLEFLRWFDWTGLQRHLKNLGIFARLHHRDNKSGYLKDMPQLLKYITETTSRYRELHPLQEFFEDLLRDEDKIQCAP